MRSLRLTVEVLAGANVADAAAEMVGLSRLLQVNLQTEFNGTPMFVCVDDTSDAVVARWDDWRRTGRGLRITQPEEA